MKASDYNYTLSEVAEEIGVGRERVRQIETIALEKVRKALAARGLTATTLDDYTSEPMLFDIKKVLLP